MELSKYEQALALYDFNLDDETIQREVNALLDRHLDENNTVEVKKFLLNSVELTTLKTTDSEDSVLHFVEKVNEFDDKYPELGHVATVCVLSLLRQNLLRNARQRQRRNRLCVRQFSVVADIPRGENRRNGARAQGRRYGN